MRGLSAGDGTPALHQKNTARVVHGVINCGNWVKHEGFQLPARPFECLRINAGATFLFSLRAFVVQDFEVEFCPPVLPFYLCLLPSRNFHWTGLGKIWHSCNYDKCNH